MKSLHELADADRYSRATDFGAMARLMLRTRGLDDASILAERERASPRVQGILKAAVSAGTMADAQSANLVDLNIVSSGFVAALANIGVFDRMLGDMVRVPLATPGIRISTTALTGYNVLEAGGKPISRINIGATTLERLKADAIIVISDEVANNASGAASALISRELRNAVASVTDSVFLAALADGVSPLPSAGATAANVYADVATMLAALDTDASSRLYLALSARTAKRLATKTDTSGARAFPDMTPQGGTIAGMPVVVSDYIPAVGSPGAERAMLLDASGIAADSDVVTLDIATHASLEMVDAADITQTSGGMGSPSAPVASTMVSLWQVNCRGLRASRFFGFKVLREAAIAVLDQDW